MRKASNSSLMLVLLFLLGVSFFVSPAFGRPRKSSHVNSKHAAARSSRRAAAPKHSRRSSARSDNRRRSRAVGRGHRRPARASSARSSRRRGRQRQVRPVARARVAEPVERATPALPPIEVHHDRKHRAPQETAPPPGASAAVLN